MKFFSAALLALLASTVEAKSPVRKLGGARVDPAKLVSKAIRVDPKTLRRLADNGEDEFQLTSAHSIQFTRCASLTMQAPDEEIMFGDFAEYTQEGRVVAEKSYVIFTVCETENCAYFEENEEATFMVDLASYMASMTPYLPTQRANYCQACEEAQEWCE